MRVDRWRQQRRLKVEHLKARLSREELAHVRIEMAAVNPNRNRVGLLISRDFSTLAELRESSPHFIGYESSGLGRLLRPEDLEGEDYRRAGVVLGSCLPAGRRCDDEQRRSGHGPSGLPHQITHGVAEDDDTRAP